MNFPTRRPTLRDVAERAGVSFKTVSRVVNGEGGVSDGVSDRVDRAIAELGYQPDDRARRLRQGESRTGTIGFVLVDVANPFFSSLLRGIEEVASEHGCLVLSGSTDGDGDREQQLVEAFIARRVDGLIVVPSGSELGVLKPEIQRNTPLVFADLEIAGCDVDIVRSDHRGGARLATQHLINHGHHDIAFVGDDTATFSAAERLAGYCEAMAEAGLTANENRVIASSFDADEWYERMHSMLADGWRPTALFSAQNFATIGTARALHALNLQHSIAQVGFDDVEFADVVEPGITVVPQDPRLIGVRSAEMLFRRIAGTDDVVQRSVLPTVIVPRGSGEIAGPHRR